MQIRLSLTAYRKMMAACASTSQEVSGFGSVSVWRQGTSDPFPLRTFRQIPHEKPYGIVFYVEDVWLLDKGNGVETTISPDKAAAFLNARLAEGVDPATLKLWWHRHPLPAGWSGTDENAIRHTPLGNHLEPKATGWMIALVWCTHTGWNARFDQLADPGFTIHLPITVEGDAEACEAQIQRELRELQPSGHPLFPAPGLWHTRPASGGTLTWDDLREQELDYLLDGDPDEEHEWADLFADSLLEELGISCSTELMSCEST
jgi:hypothetical protein